MFVAQPQQPSVKTTAKGAKAGSGGGGGGIAAAEVKLLFVGLCVFLAQLVWCCVAIVYAYSFAFVSSPLTRRWMVYSL